MVVRGCVGHAVLPVEAARPGTYSGTGPPVREDYTEAGFRLSRPSSTPVAPDAGERVKPLRADARRNRERVLDAARAAFADGGLDVQMDDVAARSGVGVGTVYRHFPTKDALVEALVEERFRQIAEIVRASLAEADPREGFSTFLWGAAELHANDRALSEIAAARPGVMPEIGQRQEELPGLMRKLIARSQDAGALRPDFSYEDIPMLMCGIGRAMEQAGAADGGERWRRFVTLLADGLATSTPTPLPEA